MFKIRHLAKRSGLVTIVALCGALGPQLGCATEDDTRSEEMSQSSDGLQVSPRITPIEVASFWSTCRDESWHSPDGRGIDHAFAGSCKMKNGQWSPNSTSYDGYCDTNLSNLDGHLHCQGQ